MKLVRLVKMCLNEMYRQLSDNFPIQNGLKQGDGSITTAIRKMQENQVGLKLKGWDTSASGLHR
jgi:hypothetical protein